MSLQHLYDLFDQIIELPTDSERSAFIERACGQDAKMKCELSELIQSHFRGSSILEAPTHALGLVGSSADKNEAEGSMVGNYKLLQKIGEGGMGVVFMAEQLRPIRRKVAVKIIREGMHSKQVIARFEAEREALARLDHPNATRILDAGVAASGRPFFAMELVRGSHITQYCNTHRIPIRERLELLEKVCMVIHHAHQKGILHRDIKPSNVMITLHDGVPVPKVIDFGIAKALDRPLTEQTLFTRYGDLIGTPEYMSPEQAEMSGLDLDVRTDIYSLGVLLYELLTGSTPLNSEQIKGKGLLKIFETIRDSEAEIPSLRVTRTLSAVDTVSEKQPGHSLALRKLIAGELDWITMKAIAKDRNERYESAAAMAKDIRRHLLGEPVDAAAPTFAYRAKKFYQKHRTITILATSSALLLLMLTALSVYWAINSNRQRELVQNQSEALVGKSRELEAQKEVAEEALARALAAEKKAESLARNERFKKTQANSNARFFGEDTRRRVEEIMVYIGKTKIPLTGSNPSATIAIQSTMAGETESDQMVPRMVGGILQGGVDINVPESVNNNIKILMGVNPDFLAPSKSASMIRFESIKRNLPPRYFEILVDELRTEFGNSDRFVAIALREFASSLSDESTPESMVLAENQLREAVSILESYPDETLERRKALINLGSVLKKQGKSLQADAILLEATKWGELEIENVESNSDESKDLKIELENAKVEIWPTNGTGSTLPIELRKKL